MHINNIKIKEYAIGTEVFLSVYDLCLAFNLSPAQEKYNLINDKLFKHHIYVLQSDVFIRKDKLFLYVICHEAQTDGLSAFRKVIAQDLEHHFTNTKPVVNG